ncbi:MAG: hypothetical protein AAF492_14140 [Verrucomicrobiota bacterium]
MDVQQDFKELLELFNKHQVEYLIVGSYALAFHGAPRYTGDIDIFVEPTESNAQRVLTALNEFGFGSLDLSEEDFTRVDHVVQLGVPPVRIDILTSISGVTWNEAQTGKELGPFGDLQTAYIGRSEYLTNKKASGRAKDIADIEALDG